MFIQILTYHLYLSCSQWQPIYGIIYCFVSSGGDEHYAEKVIVGLALKPTPVFKIVGFLWFLNCFFFFFQGFSLL